MSEKFDTVPPLLHGAVDTHMPPGDDILDFFADDVTFEFPFAPEGLPRRMNGRAALAEHFSRLGPLLQLEAFELEAIDMSGDTVVSKFSCGGRGIRTGVPYDQDYISVATFKGSRIQQ